MPMPTPRSAQWFAGTDRNSYIHRAWMRRGLPGHAFDGRPHIAIANTASDLTPCNAHLNEVAASVKQGVYEAGGIPMNLPVVSLGETNVRPTAMLWRNMAAMAAEEMLRANPIDGVVLLGGCDKTIPALLMAAASVNLPAVVLPGGPMLSGSFRGLALGCGTDVWRLSEEVRVGTLSEKDFLQSESSMIRSRGHCNTMGTASTMALMAEAREVEDLLDPTAITVTGRPLVEHLADARSWDTQGISGDAGGGEHAAAQEAVAGWRSRYGPHLRRTDERNRIWNRRPPCLARGRGRGPLGLIRTGDYVILDVPKRRLEIEAGEHELAARTPPVGATEAFANPARGWESLYVHTVQQANTGADLDFLIGASGDQVSRESH